MRDRSPAGAGGAYPPAAGGDIQPAAGHGVQEPETVGVQRRTGDEGGVLGAVEPVPGQRVAHGGEVEPQLVGAARLRQQPQQRQLPRQQRFVEGSGGKAHRVHGAAEQRAGVPADGQINAAGEGLRRSQTDAPVLPEEGIGVQRLHAQAVDIAGLGHGHDAGGATVQTVDAVEAAGAEVVAHGTGYGDGLLRQGGGMDGDAGGLIQQEEVLVLPQNIQRIGHGADVGVFPRQVGDVRRQHVSGLCAGGDDDRDAVQGDGAGPPLQLGQKAAGDAELPAQQGSYRQTGLLRGNGVGQEPHEKTPPWGYFQSTTFSGNVVD